MADFAQRISQIMEERDLSQADIVHASEGFAFVFGRTINKSSLSRWIGKMDGAEPDKINLLILARTLNVNPEWLAGLEVPKYVRYISQDESDDTRMMLHNAIDILSKESVALLLSVARQLK